MRPTFTAIEKRVDSLEAQAATLAYAEKAIRKMTDDELIEAVQLLLSQPQEGYRKRDTDRIWELLKTAGARESQPQELEVMT